MRSDAMDALRAALRAFCPTGKETVTVPQLAEALGLTTESQKQLLRRRLLILATRGETEKVGRGVWLFIPGKEPSRRGESYVRMWRAIRIQSVRDAFSSCMTRLMFQDARLGGHHDDASPVQMHAHVPPSVTPLHRCFRDHMGHLVRGFLAASGRGDAHSTPEGLRAVWRPGRRI